MTPRYFIRYDFGIYSRYTEPMEWKLNTTSALLYLGVLIEKEKEIAELFLKNWLSRFEIEEYKWPE